MLAQTCLLALSVIASARVGDAAPLTAAVGRQVLPVSNPLPASLNQNLGQYATWYPVGDYTVSPPNCAIAQVNILQRHGARYPTASAGKKITASVAKLKNATSLGSPLAFASNYSYHLGADDLTPLGAAQSYEAGQAAAQRYSHVLSSNSSLSFVRSDSSQRVVDSAGNWTAGFFSTYKTDKPADSRTLVINGATGSNDTLDDNNCPNAPDLSYYEDKWLELFAANATLRLNQLAPGAALNNADTLNYMELCIFASEFDGKISPWCGLFEDAEWQNLEYYFDLDKYYGNGYGNPLGAVQGVGYVNELLSRLSGNSKYAQQDKTQVNHTLDANPTSFPLKRTLYFDASHDNQIVSILTAIGLKNTSTLPANGPPAKQDWVTSQIVPFSGRLVTERLDCDCGQFIRFFLNDKLQIPTFCPGYNSTTGLCALDSFIESQSYARSSGDGDWPLCGYATK